MLVEDVLPPGLRVAFCGTALGAVSARVRAYYAGPGNRFWTTLHEVGLTPRRLHPQEFRELPRFGIGLTDICKTRSGSDAEVGRSGFDVPRLLRAIELASPTWLAFNGKNSAQGALGRPVTYGEQPERFGPAQVFVVPSTSGAARRYWDIEPWRALARRLSQTDPATMEGQDSNRKEPKDGSGPHSRPGR